MNKILMTITLSFFVLIIPFATSSFGAVIIVPDDQATIQAGIDAASNGDTVLVKDGTYLLTAAIDFKGKAITVASQNGAGSTILDGQDTTRIAYFHTSEGNSSVLSGFTIQNGYSDQGGGIYLDNSSPTISNCTIRDNTVNVDPNSTSYGGGIASEDSSPIITNCNIQGNSALAGGYGEAHGGGIYVNGGSPVITNSIVSGNHAWAGGKGVGGGIASDSSSISITNTDIYGNSAAQGFYLNTGGGLYFANSTPLLINCTISYNESEAGAGIYFDQSSDFSQLVNCTIARNLASDSGGGIYANSTSPKIVNSILWEDTPGEVHQNGGTTTITYSDVHGGYTGTGNINISPAFVNIAAPDLHITAASPCINAGSNSAPYLPVQDKDGNARIIGTTVDMGAYEYSGTEDTTLYLRGGRFTVQVDWVAPSGSSGKGVAVALTADSGYFWFFENTNMELLVKVHDGCGVNNKWWFFYGALTDVEYTITVTDTQTSTVKTYPGFQHIQTSSNDINAFACP